MNLLNERQRRNRWNWGAAGLSLVRCGRDVQWKSDFGYKNSMWVTSVEAISFKIIKASLIIPEQLPYFSPTLN